MLCTFVVWTICSARYSIEKSKAAANAVVGYVEVCPVDRQLLMLSQNDLHLLLLVQYRMGESWTMLKVKNV